MIFFKFLARQWVWTIYHYADMYMAKFENEALEKCP